jgi:hypothetical protein
VTPFIVLSAPLIYKRTHGDNLSSDRVRMGESHLRAMRRNLEAFRPFIENGGWESRCYEGLAHAHYSLGDSFFDAGDAVQGFDHYLRALRCRPVGMNTLRFLSRSSRKAVRVLSGGRISRRRAALAFDRAKKLLSSVRPAAA